MAKSKIEWTEYSWNPVSGCTPISEGCQNCYAKRMSKRLAGRCGYPADDPFKVTLHPDRLSEPLKWKKPRRIFVCSMGDIFHEEVPDEFIGEIFSIILDTEHKHTYLILTKRPKRALEWFRKHPKGIFVGANSFYEPIYYRWPLQNVWFGVTTENQARADERIPILLEIPAAVRFVSVEPMLEPVDLSKWIYCGDRPLLNWVICGGETGPGARPMHPDWARSLRDQCQAAGVPFFFKQWGEYKPLPFSGRDDGLHTLQEYPGCKYDFVKVGKKNAGRILDGRIWDEFPEQ